MKKSILVTGCNGQLGSEMRVIAAQYPQYEFIFTDVEELDICNREKVDEFFAGAKIDFLVNCAAYTAVDKAEEDTQLCYKINRDAVENLALAAKKQGIKLLHISTDYVFDGTGFIPYTEDTPCSPNTVYGQSKLEGEKALAQHHDAFVIIRTSWLYSSFGNNFVKTMLRLGKERDELSVIFDQIGTPTYAADLAQAIMQIVVSENFTGDVYHFSNEGVCSWFDFTKEIHRLAGINCRVQPIESGDYPAKTPRPHYSVLNKRKIKQTFGISIPYWRDSLQTCLKRLAAAE